MSYNSYYRATRLNICPDELALPCLVMRMEHQIYTHCYSVKICKYRKAISQFWEEIKQI